jgi:hypothetical protein
MSQIILLRQALKPHLAWHGARLAFLAAFLISLLRVKTVNLSEIATGFGGKAHIESHYKRMHRFFRQFEVDEIEIAKAVMALMAIPQSWVLSIDRTKWEFGEHTFNILMLGVVHQGAAFPLLWRLLGQRGNSNTSERIDLMEKFLQHFGNHRVADLTADREFLAHAWFGYLLAQPQTPFCIRIRESDGLDDGQRCLKARVLFQNLAVHQRQVLSKRRRLWGRWVYVAAVRLEDGSLLVVVSADSPESAISKYAKRWGIETLFSCLKRRGFCLESTHFTDPQRLSKLLALLALALCWCFRTGEWLHQHQPLKVKKHGRRAKSLFRYGLDHLRSILLNLEHKAEEFHLVLNFLSST